MDYKFPEQLFPSFYNCGPPDSVLRHCAGNWGCYDRVRPQGCSGPPSTWTFTSQHGVRGETWRPTEPVPIPLFSPKKAVIGPLTPPDPLDFREHMQNFFMDHCQDAFGCMGEILGENFNFKDGRTESHRKNSVHMWKVKNFLDMLNLKKCHQSYTSRALNGYSSLLFDVVHAIPPELLGSLLYEELTEQRDRLLFSEGATGGALAFVPSCSDTQKGCLIYPGNQGLDCLNFHQVVLKTNGGESSSVDTCSSNPICFQLTGPVRQISTKSLLNQTCVAVRSDHLCGVWRLCETNKPQVLQVVNTKEIATCISVSPHVLGEVLVASESGAANLWTVGKGMQKIREEDSNLYFNAKSAWRWCEFSAHPRVMLYADRTGVELTDIRVSPVIGHTLFRIGSTSECRSGERLILSRYLGDDHCFHHLVTTQYSAYVIDDRFPSVPMLKWDHLMKSPPMFCHIIPNSVSSNSAVGEDRTTKVLLGSQSAQEITMLQYSGGRAEACSSRGPPQALLKPRESLKHLPDQIPHRLETATNRLSSPAAGLTCIQQKGGGDVESVCVLQLTEAGDIFYQILKHEDSDTSTTRPAEEDALPRNVQKETLKGTSSSDKKEAADSHLVTSETSSDEGVIGPTQVLTGALLVVPETPERELVGRESSDSSCEDSESDVRKKRKWRELKLQVIVNDDHELVDDDDSRDEEGDEYNNTKKHGSIEETVDSSSSFSQVSKAPVKLSNGALLTWKQWLQKVIQRSKRKRPNQQQLPHYTVPTEGLLQPFNGKLKDPAEEERVRSLRSDLRACMSKRSLLIQKNLSTSLTDPTVEPLPNQVDTDTWTDPPSQRLAITWQGEEAWRAWWEDNLGLNKEQKMKALRRKRRREKEARRASGRRLELSGSFTSSLSYQTELSDFSDSQGLWSWGSRGELSDTEGVKETEEFSESRAPKSVTPRAVTPSLEQTDGPVLASVTPQSLRDEPGTPQTPRSSRALTTTPGANTKATPTVNNTPATQRKNKFPGDDGLSFLFDSQDEPSQTDGYFLDDWSSMIPAPTPVASSSSSQLHHSQPVPERSVNVNRFRDPFSWSQSQSLSQSSQGRTVLSQTSQPKKKKSRMGF